MKKEYQIDDFRMNTYAYKPISADSYSYGTRYDINCSSILTRLIQEAGRYCERFASDLFIDWARVEDIITGEAVPVQKSFLFGFREDGVDHDSFVFSRYREAGDVARHYYRSLWRLDISGDGERLEMVLGRVF